MQNSPDIRKFTVENMYGDGKVHTKFGNTELMVWCSALHYEFV